MYQPRRPIAVRDRFALPWARRTFGQESTRVRGVGDTECWWRRAALAGAQRRSNPRGKGLVGEERVDGSSAVRLAVGLA